MTTEELLRAGIDAAKARDPVTASKLLIQVVQSDPNSEQGWLWLGHCRTAPKEREYCFRRVLAINPQHIEARRQLDILYRSTPDSQEAKPLDPPVPPTRYPSPPSKEKPQDILPVSQKAEPPRRMNKGLTQKSRRKENATLLWFSAGTLMLICIATAGFVLFAGLMRLRNTPAPAIPPTIASAPVVESTPNYTPTFETAPCEFGIPDEANVTCGFAIVPEDRSGDVADTIRIAVAIYHSTGNAPKPDPILYLQGGPGQKAIAWSVDVYPSMIAPLIADRDFIVFDPRGVGFSEPTLDCDEIKRTYLSDIQGRIPSGQRASYYEGALLTCKNELIKTGVNLSTYISTQVAADARDILVALGYQQANLYGISYGTRVAQFIMRDHPEVVRSAILDSVVPIETQLFNQGTEARERVLHVLFEDCRADPACSAAYPDLESVYDQAISQLDAQPVRLTIPIDEGKVHEQVIDGPAFRGFIIWMLRSPRTIAAVPQMIYRTHDGDHSTLTLSIALPIYAFESISIGTYISVNCHDQLFAMSTEQLDKTVYELCRLWDVKPPAPGENDPISSEIPTLIFAGKYDTVTPVAFAEQLAGHLSESHVALVLNQGHAPSATGISDCPTKLISAFLREPIASPDFTCLNESGSIKFIVPFDPNAPLSFEPVIIDLYQIATRIPADWEAAEFGFFNRSGSFGDNTQIGIQRAAVSESEWAVWLSTNFRVNKGFDEAAVKYDERKVNGLTWSIYRASSQGNPVDMAFARSGNDTLMVLMFSSRDEHDALYNAVFLPVTDSTKSSR